MKLVDDDVKSTFAKTGMSAGAVIALAATIAAITYIVYQFVG